MTLTDFIGPEVVPGALDALSLWAGLLVLWLVVLSWGVVGQRRRLKVAFGDGGHVSLTAAGRAFGMQRNMCRPA